MKNIHVLPTLQPNRFSLNSSGKYHLTNQLHPNSPNFTNQHIYITNDVEIKEGDSVILKSGRLTKAELRNETLGFQTIDGIAFLYFQEGDKKVILTTDQDLIKDGVQAIPDEFLNWFVNNPTCEYVDAYKDKRLEIEEDFHFYEILIPKKEPKQFDIRELNRLDDIEIEEMSNDWETMKEQVKQETLEEAAEKYCLINNIPTDQMIVKTDRSCEFETPVTMFIQGAKWQADRMYSEEDIRKAIDYIPYEIQYGNLIGKKSDEEINKFIEQFKKK
jgi:hypothetical protein